MSLREWEWEWEWELKWFTTGMVSFVTNRAQTIYKMVSNPPLGLTDVEEATSEAADATDHIDGCAGEPLSDVKGSLDGGEGGGVAFPAVAGNLAKAAHLKAITFGLISSNDVDVNGCSVTWETQSTAHKSIDVTTIL
eukprot:g26879.t1